MTNHFEKHSDMEPQSLEHILTSLRALLPSLAKDLVASTRDISQPLEKTFYENPDNPAEHSPQWHQYGIITHSEKFREFIETAAPGLLEDWQMKEKADTVLSEEIDGMTKADLLQITSLVHDLGKFTARTFEYKNDKPVARFVGHEEHSGAIIRSDFAEKLKELGLTDSQIDYIALCAEHHFDLGQARELAKKDVGYTLTFARSEKFKQIANDIIDSAEGVALEVGLMFMADSLSKTEIASTANTDEAVEADRDKLLQQIHDKGLNPDLINQALQQPVNIEIGKAYLSQWATRIG